LPGQLLSSRPKSGGQKVGVEECEDAGKVPVFHKGRGGEKEVREGAAI